MLVITKGLHLNILFSVKNFKAYVWNIALILFLFYL